jgi:uncharacterized Fe-S cluster-containing radical SAM superfamily protein
VFNFDVVAAHQETCDSETPEFLSGDEIRQVFTSLENFLYRIELLFSSNSKAGDGRLCFELYEGNRLGPQAGERPPPLVSSSVEISRVYEGGWRSFEFSPLRNSQGRMYTILLKMTGSGQIRLRKIDGVGEKYSFRSVAEKGVLAYRAFGVRDFIMYDNFQILRNEMQSNNARVKHRPIMLRLEISTVCNQKCVMCAHGQDNFRLEKTDAKHMSLEVFKKIVAPLLPTTSVLVAFGLGEPFLNKELMEILRQAKTINPLTNIFVSTNGTRLSEEISREIVTGHLIDVLQISIDGASEETYAKIRKRAKPGNDYDIVLDALKTVVRIKKQYNQNFPKIKVEMLVNQHTSNDIFMYVEQMTNLGVNMIALDSVKGEYAGLGLAECDIPSVYAELQRARAYAEGAGVSMEGPLFNELSALLSTVDNARVGVG